MRIAYGFALSISSLLAASAASAQLSGVLPRTASVARSVAMGGAAGALEQGADWFTNPAAIAARQTPQVTLDHRRFDDRRSLDRVALVLPWHSLEATQFGLRLSLLQQAGLEAGDVFDGFEGTRGTSEFHAQMGLAQGLSRHWLWGLGLGFLQAELDADHRTRAWTAQAGVLYRRAATRFSLSLQNLTMHLTDDGEPQPYRYQLSSSIAQALSSERVWLALQMDRGRGEDAVFGAGVEIQDPRGLAIRVGSRRSTAADDEPFMTGGFGYRRSGFGFDYGLQVSRGLVPQHFVSFGLLFGDEPEIGYTQRDASDRSQTTLPAERQTTAERPVPPQAQRQEPERLPLRDTLKATHSTPSQESAQKSSQPLLREPQVETPRQAAPQATQAPAAPAPTPRLRPNLTNETPVDAASRSYVVRGGVHLDTDSASIEVAKFYRAKLRPRLERRGELLVVVLRRCESREEAEAWLQKALEANLKCSIDVE